MPKKKMTKKDLAYFKKLISDQLQETKNSLQENPIQNTTQYDNQSINNIAGQHQIEDGDYSGDQFLELASRGTKFLKQLEYCLFNIDNKTYGQCETCKTLIPKERLEAVLVAKNCITCKLAK